MISQIFDLAIILILLWDYQDLYCINLLR